MKKRISICLNDDTILRIKQYAKDQHLSVSSAIEFLIWNKNMKSDINSFNKKIRFSNLDAAKHYFLFDLEKIKKDDDFTENKEKCIGKIKKFNCEVTGAVDLDNLASVLNKYSDNLGNGSCFKAFDDILEFNDVVISAVDLEEMASILNTYANFLGNNSWFKVI